MSKYPTAWQKKIMWAALSAIFVVLLIVIAGSAIWVAANLIAFLQPILMPVAIAVILAYLLDPLVTKISRGGLSRTRAVLLLFAVAAVAFAALMAWLVPTISMQSGNFVRELPNYTQKARDRIVDLIVQYNRAFSPPSGTRAKSTSATSGIVNLLLGTPAPHAPTSPATAQPTVSPPLAETASSPAETIAPAPAKISSADRQRFQARVDKLIPNLERYVPTLAEKFWDLLKKSIGGFLGFTGFLFSLVLVPIYLFFLLKERPRIERRWRDYLPLRDSPLKDEVAEVLSEINHYIIAYFRGQLMVCLIDGVLIGSVLTIYPGLNFAPVIGCLVVVLTMIPYIGIILCWIPAVIIAAFQFGDWTHPLIVTLWFIIIQNIEGMFYAPRIVGDSVGLHPMTVIVSIFVWGLLIGGLLGPILAVPLTATLKVLLMRYVWGRHLREEEMAVVEHVPVVAEAEHSEA
ncbi:MAG TPA: AI-2E family transporter [Chthoniobacterales bacterium]|jgi:predicted PurR-regulated permease PerM